VETSFASLVALNADAGSHGVEKPVEPPGALNIMLIDNDWQDALNNLDGVACVMQSDKLLDKVV
jgi:hypothetical protein